jgi:hypothetical protein
MPMICIDFKILKVFAKNRFWLFWEFLILSGFKEIPMNRRSMSAVMNKTVVIGIAW